VVVAQDQGRRLLGRQLAQSPKQVGAFGQDRGVGRWGGPAEAPDDLTGLPETLMPAIGDRDVDGDPVEPGLRRRVGTPRLPALVGALEGILRAVLGCRPIPQQGDQGAQDPPVRAPVQAFEIRLRTGLVIPGLRSPGPLIA
jgi:hypothetical protein